MRAVGLHADVIVVTSRVWQTTCTLVRGGDEAFVVDSPVYPDELQILPSLLEQARFDFAGLLATHADFDHLLGRLAFPDASLGVAITSAERLRSQPGAAQRELRDFDERHYVRRERPLALGALQALPVPGRCGLGDRDLLLHPAPGHTADGMAIVADWAGVLVCGDYLSPIELPTLGQDGSLAAYLQTLERLEALVQEAAHVVPGHGPVLGREQALGVLAEDRAYLVGLREDPERVELPAGRTGAHQRRLHAANRARLAGPQAAS
ncbi:MAG TPA: MBL fold metallo-hydrolase [Solirubrobacteraceae bacterium]|jgi:glyoxylase-like metal-dependent hydrolase (beta-lactamase superfamily II)|nr:MBL fold metallo-hydrolase [Solirubrobacteraceae bacterium]